MTIKASLNNEGAAQQAILLTNGIEQRLNLPVKSNAQGSAINGGELLCLALATCFCNDLYREAKKKSIILTKVVVEATAEFNSEGGAASDIRYSAQIEGDADPAVLKALLSHTDTVAEVHNTLRKGVGVTLIV